MQNQGSTSPLRVSLPLVSLYVAAVAAVYQWAFWGPFEINILHFTTLADMVKMALWPLIGVAIGLAVGYVAGHIGGTTKSPVPPLGVTGFRKLRAFVNAFPNLVIFALLFLALTIKFFIDGHPLRWFHLGILAAFTIYTVLMVKDVFVSLLPNDRTRHQIVFVLTLLPCIAWGIARQSAEEIRRGIGYQQVHTTPEFRDAARIPASADLRHLGNTGSYTIMLVNGGPQLVITRNEELGPVTLTPVRKEIYAKKATK